MKRLIKSIILLLIGAVLGIITHIVVMSSWGYKMLTPLEMANFNTLPYKVEVIKAYNAYYNAVENLLDSTNLAEDDTVLETNYGSNYLNQKWRIDSLVNLERDELAPYKPVGQTINKFD